ncbi:WYL domain-containing protein [Citrobacter freundii]|uniref:WYL domain-containing protein n=2 Tax=Citrobacter TaxID=544 RepID=A0A4P6WFT9_9ENTR|nr:MULTISPECIES: WYL domain-containing protein [Enterobacteriaceae]ECM9980403.1 WYL domain-containing protein [Salmonella enterica subsp. enterica serovar Enteritidis]EGZ6776126.1 WYL domain-containing protein [Escherichia coli]ELO4448995.1 WYL domain-containing protein [Salmonella enterica subsp. enterica serovar London]ECV7991200.1 WYL domain-containing protein [Salmonella enterica subsp. enterica serovar Enteritidis]EGZ6827650.1 WYL domain-containing protein [Escherichia coli]
MKNIRNQNFIDDRLWHIEWLLMMRGWLSRIDLMDKFGIKGAAASRDIKRYKEQSGDNLYLDHRVKRYVADFDKFKPIYEASEDLIFSKLTDLDESRFLGAGYPLIETIPSLAEINPKDITSITRAILNMNVLNISYYSMTSGASEKKIVPHSMFYNDLKTYVRCYDLGRCKFLDLVVGRIQEIFGEDGSAPAECLREFDDDWNTYISLELVVHPRVQHKKAIESDMQMTDGVKLVEVRKSLAHYWLRRWCVDCSATASMTDKSFQLHLRNSSVIKGVNGAFPGVNNHID